MKHLLFKGLLLVYCICFSHAWVFGNKKANNKQFSIESPDFQDGNFLNDEFTPQGEDNSPSLEWKNAPEKTRKVML